MDVAPRRQRGPGPITASSAEEAPNGPTVGGGPAGPGAQVLAHARFERIAETDPDRQALLAAGEELTYGELNARAESLAASLRARGVGADSVVGIMLPRRAEAVVAVLAVLKA